MTPSVTHPLISAYLRDLEMLLHGIDPGERAEVLAGVHEHLDASLQPSASNDDVRRTLAELGSPQSIADEAYAGHPASRPTDPLAGTPVAHPSSPWPPLVACVLNTLMLVPILFLGWLGGHPSEWLFLGPTFTIPWFILLIMTAKSDAWTSTEKSLSILLIPSIVIGLGLATWLVTWLTGWHTLWLRVLTLAAVVAAAWMLGGLVRSARRHAH